MEPRRKKLFLAILQYALLNIRALGEKGRAVECAIEADHVHNIPEIVAKEDRAKEKYYWDVERELYLKQADVICSGRFEIIWSDLARLDIFPDQYTIHIPICVEGHQEADEFCPTTAIKIGQNAYKVLASESCKSDPRHWLFPPGSIVECDVDARGILEMLIAKQRVG